ncbi:hypothetical protein DET49_101276 [Salegentibacter sp. 24]|nr:hypothetical protein DET49_101276 [Salegentibacter sp. 24]
MQSFFLIILSLMFSNVIGQKPLEDQIKYKAT